MAVRLTWLAMSMPCSQATTLQLWTPCTSTLTLQVSPEACISSIWGKVRPPKMRALVWYMLQKSQDAASDAVQCRPVGSLFTASLLSLFWVACCNALHAW